SQHWPQEDRRRLTDVAETVHSERRALPRGRRPARDVSHPDRERRPRDAEGERDREQAAIARGQRDEQGRYRADDHQDREDGPCPEAVGEEARGKPGQRAEEDGHRHQQRRLARGETEVGAEAGSERAHQSPGREAQGEGQRAEGEGAGLHGTRPVATIVPSTLAKRTVWRTRSTRRYYIALAVTPGN